MLSHRIIALAGATVLLTRVASPGQAPPSGGLILRSDTRTVQIDISVKDSQGHPVHGLRKEDFVVTDNGKRREIQLFSGDDTVQTSPAAIPAARALPRGIFSNRFGPRTVQGRVTAIVLDNVDFEFEKPPQGKIKAPLLLSYSLSSVLNIRLNAYKSVLRAIEAMQPGDANAIFAVTPELQIVCDYTTDRDLLRKSLEAWKSDGRASVESPLNDDPALKMLTALRDVATHMSGAPGRKSIVWVTPGIPSPADLASIRYRLHLGGTGRPVVLDGTTWMATNVGYMGIQEIFDSTMRAINDANVALYPVDSRGVNAYPDYPVRWWPGLEGLDTNITVMQGIAKETGGKAYYMRNDVDAAIGEALDETRYTYELGFYLSPADFDGKFHELGVKVPGQPKLTLRYRQGYNATVASEADSKEKHELETELLSPLDASGLGMDARVEMVHGPKGSQWKVSLGLDPATIGRGKDGSIALDETLVETDANGAQLAKVQESLQFRLPAGQPAARYTRTIDSRDGATTLHVVVRDKTTGHVGSLTVPLAGLDKVAQ